MPYLSLKHPVQFYHFISSPLVAPVGSQNAGSYAGYSINVYNQGLTYSQQPNFKQGLPMANVFSGFGFKSFLFV